MRKDPSTKTLGARIRKTTDEKLQAYVAESGMKIASTVDRAILEYIERRTSSNAISV